MIGMGDIISDKDTISSQSGKSMNPCVMRVFYRADGKLRCFSTMFKPDRFATPLSQAQENIIKLCRIQRRHFDSLVKVSLLSFTAVSPEVVPLFHATYTGVKEKTR